MNLKFGLWSLSFKCILFAYLDSFELPFKSPLLWVCVDSSHRGGDQFPRRYSWTILALILLSNQDSTSALSNRQCFPILAQGIWPWLHSLYSVDFGILSHMETSSAFNTSWDRIFTSCLYCNISKLPHIPVWDLFYSLVVFVIGYPRYFPLFMKRARGRCLSKEENCLWIIISYV